MAKKEYVRTPALDTPEEREIINKAKEYLMATYKITEVEAYKHIRKTAMDNKMRKIEVATWILNSAGVNT